MIRIDAIQPGSIAEALELAIGSRVIRINGEPVRDGIDFRFLEAESVLEVEVAPADADAAVVYEIEKDAGEPLGVVPAPDAVRECANKCVFCFIDGNPEHVRRSLWLRDDDFRLSFTYGSYVTLTNLGPRGFQRLIDQRLSPLYVSVHATEPAVRERLLGVPRGGDIVAQLRRLVEAGIEVHTQVVLCPEWNDGAHLDRTLDELWALGPGVLTASVVPVGLTRYNLERPVRLLRPERGGGWAYVGDEMWFIAERPLPDPGYYDDGLLTENGVGGVHAFLEETAALLRRPPELRGRRIAVVTGTRMAPVMAPLLERIAAATGADIEVLAVENRLFGATVTTAGLLPGEDMARALAAARPFDTALLPAEALNDDALFIDDLPLAGLRERFPDARLVPGHRLGETLGGL
ncbi:MAG TPA: DUF512 domain-containing protein [Longimicrobiales bacterium]|nr:DUF512 domain-containing protein [Longimicrobiales bacterium]